MTEELERGTGLWEALSAIGPLRDVAAVWAMPLHARESGNLRSRWESSWFVLSQPRSVRRFARVVQIRRWAVDAARPDGLFLEFGVASALSTHQIARRMQFRAIGSPLFGFDWFQGLPDDWRPGLPKGRFRQEALPPVEKNVELVVGRFEETLGGFLDDHPGVASFVHIDCDLYSSARFVLAALLRARRLAVGTILLFDELYNYPGWFQGGEFRALRELLPTYELDYECRALVPLGRQAAFELVDRRRPLPHRPRFRRARPWARETEPPAAHANTPTTFSR